MRSNLALAALVAALGACGGGQGADAPPRPSSKISLEVWDYTLPNGLRVILDEDKAAPTIAMNMRYKVGSKDDPPGRAGFAHLVEHLMIEDTPWTGAAGALPDTAVGHDTAGTTNLDRTEYHEVFASNALEWFVWFEAQRLTSLAQRINPTNFAKERNVVKNELRQNHNNVELGNVYGLELRAMFGKDHPYGHTTIGTLEELDAATLEEVHAFHKKFYQPSNAIFTLVGNFDHKQASEYIAKYFGPIPNAPASPVRTAPPALKGERRIFVEAGIRQPHLRVAYPAPPDGSTELPAMRVALSHVFGRAEYLLVEERRLARAVSWGVHEAMLGSMVVFDITLNPNADPNEALRVVDKAVEDIETNVISNIDRTTSRYKLDLLLDFEKFSERAELYGHYDDLTRNPLAFARMIEAIDKTGRAAVFASLEKYILPKDRVLAFVTPVPAAPLGGRLAERTR